MEDRKSRQAKKALPEQESRSIPLPGGLPTKPENKLDKYRY